MNELLKQLQEALEKALKDFGTYAYDDKGPSEVMNIGPWAKKLRELSPADAASVLRKLITTSSGRGARLASCLLGDLEDWDPLWEEEGIPELY